MPDWGLHSSRQGCMLHNKSWDEQIVPSVGSTRRAPKTQSRCPSSWPCTLPKTLSNAHCHGQTTFSHFGRQHKYWNNASSEPSWQDKIWSTWTNIALQRRHDAVKEKWEWCDWCSKMRGVRRSVAARFAEVGHSRTWKHECLATPNIGSEAMCAAKARWKKERNKRFGKKDKEMLKMFENVTKMHEMHRMHKMHKEGQTKKGREKKKRKEWRAKGGLKCRRNGQEVEHVSCFPQRPSYPKSSWSDLMTTRPYPFVTISSATINATLYCNFLVHCEQVNERSICVSCITHIELFLLSLWFWCSSSFSTHETNHAHGRYLVFFSSCHSHTVTILPKMITSDNHQINSKNHSPAINYLQKNVTGLVNSQNSWSSKDYSYYRCA